ncbi:MAG: hypothetical protein IJ519_02155 [Clostridia bacterium]|nr:hypothetical protein [Clostridia bacterium]
MGLRLTVPDGWRAYYGIDSDGKITPKKIHVYKGSENVSDVYSKVGITVCVFPKEEIYLSAKGFYLEVTDIEAVSIGAHLYEGYTCTSCGYPYTMLVSKNEEYTLQIMVLMKNGKESLSLYDNETLSVISSIEVTYNEWDLDPNYL